jgi:DNA end-binding protein Ku
VSFGLVNIPVRLYTATASHDIHFHEYQARTGQRIHHKRVAEKSGREVDFKDIVKGYEVSRGKVVLLDPDEVAALEPRKTRTIEIEQFVDLADVDPIVWDATYYLGPGDKGGAKSYELLRRAMVDSGKVGIGRFVLRTKEYLATVRPLGKGLALETMHFPDEIRAQEDVITELPGKVAVTPKEMALARQLIDSLSAKWDHGKFEDSYRDRVVALIQKKARGEAIEVEEAPEPSGKVVDLMEALKASLESGNGKPASKAAGKPRRKPPRRRSGGKRHARAA